MKTVWKYTILNERRFDLQMPLDARILCLQVQGGTACIWAELHDNNPLETRRFTIVGTGDEVPPAAAYIATWQDGPLVWHLYEKATNAKI